MRVRFIKVSPTKNMTVLVETPLPQEEHLDVGKRLIAADSIGGEQAGFIQEARNPKAAKALRMMAGEFCGNGALSLAAWLMEREGLPIGETKEVWLEVSGAKNLVQCKITRAEWDYFGSVEMPLPVQITERVFFLDGAEYALPVVEFFGITHVIVDRKLWGSDARGMAERAAKAWKESLPPVFGILLWEEETTTLEPLVCVKDASLIWENCCGSGTSAIGVYLAQKQGRSVSLECIQPGGTMGVKVRMEDGRVSAVQIAGHVAIVAQGTAYI